MEPAEPRPARTLVGEATPMSRAIESSTPLAGTFAAPTAGAPGRGRLVTGRVLTGLAVLFLAFDAVVSSHRRPRLPSRGSP